MIILNNEVIKMLIGISGKQRAGKDTFADYYVKKYGFTKKSFADELKKLAVDYFGLERLLVYRDKPKYVRKILQDIGKVGREVNPDFWVKKTLSDYNGLENQVISDVRYVNEADQIHNMGGILIRIDANRDVRLKRGKLAYENDLSETELDDYPFDYIVDNNSSFEFLYFQADKIYKQLREKYGNQ